MGKLDQRKSDWDVMEHVLGGVRAIDQADQTSRVVDLEGRPWMGNHIRTDIRLTVIEEDGDDTTPRR